MVGEIPSPDLEVVANAGVVDAIGVARDTHVDPLPRHPEPESAAISLRSDLFGSSRYVCQVGRLAVIGWLRGDLKAVSKIELVGELERQGTQVSGSAELEAIGRGQWRNLVEHQRRVRQPVDPLVVVPEVELADRREESADTHGHPLVEQDI